VTPSQWQMAADSDSSKVLRVGVSSLLKSRDATPLPLSVPGFQVGPGQHRLLGSIIMASDWAHPGPRGPAEFTPAHPAAQSPGDSARAAH
jgi:hypothetical protein